MAGILPSANKKLKFNISLKPDHKIAIVVSEWNLAITSNLLKAAKTTLELNGLKNQLVIVHVPGAFELPLTSSWLLKKKKIEGVICLGCVIQGETKHDDYINHSIAQAFINLSLLTGKPLIYGVLTTNTKKQALDRSGGKLGNKGEECAIALLKMLSLKSIIKTL
ncbi:MAG: 6,7-dimethyl-8-ribityllumazine synthase [Saprospiraceae bacterium]